MEAGSLLLDTTTSVLVPSQLNPVNVFTIYLSFFHLRQSLNMVCQFWFNLYQRMHLYIWI